MEPGESANIDFTIDSGDLSQAFAIADELIKDFPRARYEVSEPVSKVSVIGIGMRSHSGVAEKMFETLARNGINIQSISTSEIVISCMVSGPDGHKALQLLHAAFDLDRNA